MGDLKSYGYKRAGFGKSFRVWLAVLFFIVAWCFVSTNDYNAEQKEERHYCKMVADGLWPAYRKDINCGELK